MSDRERIRREAIQKTGRDLREQAARSGHEITQTQAEARVRAAAVTSDNKRNK